MFSRSTDGSPVMSEPSTVVRRNGLMRSSFWAWLLNMVVAEIVVRARLHGQADGQALVEIGAEGARVRGHLDEIVLAADR